MCVNCGSGNEKQAKLINNNEMGLKFNYKMHKWRFGEHSEGRENCGLRCWICGRGRGVFGFVRVFCVDFSNRDFRLNHVRILNATSANAAAPRLLVAVGDLTAAAQVAMVAKFLGNYLVVSPALMCSFLLAVAEAS